MINLLLPNQVESLRALDAIVIAAPDYEAACRVLVVQVATILSTPVTLLECRAEHWRAVAQTGDDTPLALLVSAATASPFHRNVIDIPVAGKGDWTRVSLGKRNQKTLVLMFAGNWTLSQPILEEVAVRMAALLKHVERKAKETPIRTTVAKYAFARRLAKMGDPQRLHRVIADTFAAAVDAQKASLALFDPKTGTLAIAATSGYPFVLVKHLRFQPGSGIIGAVYQSGRPLFAENARLLTDVPALRLRYRTPSFLSLPLAGAGEVLGVVSVADRRDGGEFDRRDLKTLRALGGIASLALDRERCAEEARGSTHMAAIDSLTGLFNRRQFHVRLEEEVERARRQRSPLTAIMLDVDNFKQLNDRLGHLAGDAVLRIVADVLRRSVRLFDVCARYGGDEYAVLMPGSGPESSAQIAERIREGIEDCRPPGGPWSNEIRVTASIGLASFAATTGEELLIRADQALYLAKRDGKNRVRMSGGSDGES